PAPAKAPEGPVGALKVLSEPAVDVYVDGERLGRTPLDTELPTGKTTLRLTDRRTGINVYRTVLLDPERPARIDELFETGELVVRAPRGAHIHLNGRFLGEAPLNGPAKIYEGPCLLKVTYEGMRWTERFNAEAGRRVSFDVEEKRL
ncbi:MAG: PEGA domain-containing protein, partial [Myxococcota bacterium]